MRNAILFLACFLGLFSCSRYPANIEAVLKQAGNNRGELEKVLKHYSRHSADSLKLHAATFLIVNMPGKYSEYYDAPWNDIAALSLRWTSSPDKEGMLNAYRRGETVKKDDLTHITAEYLINNIDLSFKVWQERPWGKHIPFEVFCEEILPYRLDTEPLENWREKALASFADFDAQFNEAGATAVEACRLLNRALPRFTRDTDFPVMNFSQLMASARGSCFEITALAVFSMRALGIPVTVDYYTRGLERGAGHRWNCVSDSLGNHIRFMGTETDPERYYLGETPIKVYRNRYALQASMETKDGNIPALLKTDANAADVSDQYIAVSDVNVPLRYQPAVPTGYVFLAYEDRQQWLAIAWAAETGQTAGFSSMKRNMLYLPVYYANHIQTVAGDAFWLDNDGNTIRFPSDFQNIQDTVLTLNEIIPSFNLSSSFLLHGVFEGANKPDFSDAKVIYTIKDLPGQFYNEVVLSKPAHYRYVRYKSPKGSRCHVAEIVFWDENNEKLSGTNIGTPGAWKNSDHTCDKAFDGDITTFYEAAEDEGSWTGLDLQERKSIGKIHYLPSTAGNNIYTGHDYELFYWTKDGWQSLGIQTAVSGALQYPAPKQALFYLANLTLLKNGYTFFIAPDSKIQWQLQ